MASHEIIGIPDSGKSYYTAVIFKRLLKRNWKWWKKSGKKRKILSNLKVSEKWLNHKSREKYKEFIEIWEDPSELIKRENVDIIWDENATDMESRDWEHLDKDIKSFIQQHDKNGIDIYANTQAPMQVDVMFRRNCKSMVQVTKLFGNRRPHPTKPPVKWIWGLIMIRKLKRVSFSKEEDKQEFEPIAWYMMLWAFEWITRDTCEFFDTHQKIYAHTPPLKHVVQTCPTCGFTKIHGKITNQGNTNCTHQTAGSGSRITSPKGREPDSCLQE